MKVRQKSIRIYEIITNNYDKVLNFVQRRGDSLNGYLLVIKTENDKIKEYFLHTDLQVKFIDMEFEFVSPKQAENEEKKSEDFKNPVNIATNKDKVDDNTPKHSTKTEIFDKIVRSGEEIVRDCKLIFLNKINDGAKIYSSDVIEVYGEVSGKVVCDGEYMIVKKSKKGSIVFQNEEMEAFEKLSFVSRNGIKEL